MQLTTVRPNHRVLALAVLSVSLAGFARESTADVLLSDNFEGNATNNVVPAGWSSYKNWTKGATATGTSTPNSFQMTSTGAGHPFYGRDYPDNAGRFVAASGGGPNPSDIDLWMVSPALALNGSAAEVSFWTFSMSASTAALEVRLSAGSGVVPNNGGASDNDLPTPLYGGVGDFTTTLLSINPTHQSGVYPTFATDGSFTPAWTQYTATIPAGLVSGTGYIAFRSFGSNVFGSANNYKIVALDDVLVSSIATPNFIKGDFNGDGIGDFGDLEAALALLDEAAPFSGYLATHANDFVSFYGAPGTEAALTFMGDFNTDGAFDFGDLEGYLTFLDNGGSGLTSNVSVVPEPASLSLLAIAGIALGARRRAIR